MESAPRIDPLNLLRILLYSAFGKNAELGIFSDIPSSGIFRVVGGDLAQSLCFISENSEY